MSIPQTKIYTGIGSRKTPLNILTKFKAVGRRAAELGWELRSGGAEGADETFEQGCAEVNGKKEIYLPWRRWRKNDSPLYYVSPEAFNLACQFHPAWDMCSNMAKEFHGRNSYQILGLDLNIQTDVVVCWTPASGGTTQALRIARSFNIPILNLLDK